MNPDKRQRSVLSLLSQYRGIVMGFAALTIVYFHEWQFLFAGHDRLLRLEEVFHRSIIFGPDLFFLMSGVGLTFAVSNWVDNHKKLQVQRQTAMMAVYDIDEIIREMNFYNQPYCGCEYSFQDP